MRRGIVLTWLLALASCERSSTAPPPEPTFNIESAWTPPDSGIVGRRLEETPAVRVRDAAGDPVAGLEVTFVPTLRAVPTAPYIATTDANGLATYTPGWILSGRMGRQELLVVPQGATGAQTSFAVDAKSDTATQLRISFGAVVSLAIGDSVLPTLTFEDLFGNPTTSPHPIVYEFSDSTVLESAGEWVRAIGVGTSLVVARAGGMSVTTRISIGTGEPTLIVERLRARSGFGLAIDPNRILYSVSIVDVGIQRIDLTTEMSLSNIGSGFYWSVAYVPVRDEIWAVRYDESQIDVFSASTGASIASVVLPRGGMRLLPSPDGSVVFVTGVGSGLMRVATADRSVTLAPGAGGDQVNGIAFSSDGARVLTTSVGDGVLREYDAVSLALLRSVELGGNPQEVLVDTLTGRVIVMREFAPIVVLDEVSWVAPPGSPPNIYGAYGASLTASGEYIIVTTLGGDVNILDASTLESYATVAAVRSRRVAIDPGSGRAWVVQEDADELIRITLSRVGVPP